LTTFLVCWNMVWHCSERMVARTMRAFFAEIFFVSGF
jgi:hypothetical protein